MAEFCIEIAGHTAAVTSIFESTRDYCRAYLTEAAPEISIAVTREEMTYEQFLSEEEARQEGFRLRKFSDPFLERAVIQRKLAEYLLTQDVLMLHGSAIGADGRGYLFMARSGTGKSTHTRLWCQLLGQRAVMVNDDKPFLKFTPQGILLCGSPWSGKHGLDSNTTVPLKGICLLSRGSRNQIHPIPPSDAEAMLRWQSCPPLNAQLLPRHEVLLSLLLQKASFWHMECTKEPEAAAIAFAAMTGTDPL